MVELKWLENKEKKANEGSKQQQRVEQKQIPN